VLTTQTLTSAGTLPMRWARGMRRRENPSLAHARLRWYRESTRTYRLTAGFLTPGMLRLLVRLDVSGLDNVPAAGPVILAPNHLDNLDPYLLLYLIPRMVHVAARPDGFGTGGLCAVWRRLGAFPADAWGMRYALCLLAEERVVAIFPQATISSSLGRARGAVGLLALRSGAPVVPVAIEGTDRVHAARSIVSPTRVSVRFGEPITFSSATFGSQRSLAVADEILGHVRGLLTAGQSTTRAAQER
jgi:1-acyl-sn-glycerol-3-phosphate acyltransferase